ncbi:Nmad3 family putative nucleotide modification protein [Microbulbifer celer]|uniref:Nucleotide modification associated domain-containing protein n=1 Tax=Microbulbifer celer TaxID=435905 RepID=A0ABW3UAF6_9GAMM|nr:hypothetical protein [Microbulbifer celer]UFN56909.1 hypothetical protein LPW13_15250 [Microbulbifer celer]
MKLILSRKGFDFAAGGCPSPILPDGRLCSLPIPDSQSRLHYRDLTVNGMNAGDLIADLTRNPDRANETAHLDPDLDPATRSRAKGWRGLLGQDGTAQSHLRNQSVDSGDLFLFFGLFRRVEQVDGCWRFIKSAPARHVIWGWLQVGAVHSIAELAHDALPWAHYHPHFSGERGKQNTLYTASDALMINGTKLPGKNAYGTFGHYKPSLQLTAEESNKPSDWRLPVGLFPTSSATAMTYHQKLERWKKEGKYCRLKAAARGQEFVLDANQYPDVAPWIATLFDLN